MDKKSLIDLAMRDMNIDPESYVGPKFKLTPQLEKLIAGHLDIDQFIKDVNAARAFLGSTKIFGSSYKLDKSNSIDSADMALIASVIDTTVYLNIVCYMPPSDSSGIWNFCAWATAGCEAVCLGIGSGRMNHGYENIARRQFNWNKDDTARAQMKRALLFMTNRKAFIAESIVEINAHLNTATRKGLQAAVRPNGTTDIPWETTCKVIFEIFGQSIQWYDYTKAPLNVRRNVPSNYHLTFSRAETAENQRNAQEYIKAGFNAAVVFKAEKHKLPAEFEGMPVLDGDIHYMRFKDQGGHWVGLSAKGAAKHDKSGFVVQAS